MNAVRVDLIRCPQGAIINETDSGSKCWKDDHDRAMWFSYEKELEKEKAELNFNLLQCGNY